MSESPILECFPLCKKFECYAYRPPDTIFTNRLVIESPNKYSPIKLPENFSSATTHNFAELIRTALNMIMPGMSLEDSIKYLSLASYLLFVYRAYDGIMKSDSSDLIPIFNDVLSRGGTKYLGLLGSLLNNIRNADLNKNSAEVLANRTKAIFSLLMAIKVMERESFF